MPVPEAEEVCWIAERPEESDVVYETVAGGSISVYRYLIKPLSETAPEESTSSARFTAVQVNGVIGLERVTVLGTVSIIRENIAEQRSPKDTRLIMLSNVMLKSLL